MSRKRTTKADIYSIANVINRRFKSNGYNVRIRFAWISGRSRAELYNVSTGHKVSELSPVLRLGLMLEWLTAYWKGLSIGLMVSDKID